MNVRSHYAFTDVKIHFYVVKYRFFFYVFTQKKDLNSAIKLNSFLSEHRNLQYYDID